MINIKTKQEVDKMRESGRIAALILAEVKKIIKIGVTTAQLNKLAEDLIKKYEVKPAFKDYNGYPASLCTSLNRSEERRVGKECRSRWSP